ncbi:MAG: hypothetical protein ABSA52_17505 [Candidatus Binatia bacterium]|jgi:hypothetical protein
MENSTTFTRDWRVKIGTLAMALAIVSAAVVVRPARADEHEHHDRRAHQQRQYRQSRRHRPRVIYAPAPDVYYAPPPVVYAPPPPPGGFTFIFPFRIR